MKSTSSILISEVYCRMRRWIPLALFAFCLSLMALCRWSSLTGKVLSRPTLYLGIIPIVLGLGIAFRALRQLKKAGTTVEAFGKPRKLVTGGIFRYSRNPAYLGLALVLGGACMLFSARCALLPVALFVTVADLWFIRAEEKVLRQEFGPQFDQYCVKTRRWL